VGWLVFVRTKGVFVAAELRVAVAATCVGTLVGADAVAEAVITGEAVGMAVAVFGKGV
jgi:hypothetical protein